MMNAPPQLMRLVQLQGSAQKGDLHPRGKHSQATQSSGSTKPLELLLLEVFALAQTLSQTLRTSDGLEHKTTYL